MVDDDPSCVCAELTCEHVGEAIQESMSAREPSPSPRDEPWWTNCKEVYEQCKADVSCNRGMDEAEQQGTCVLSLSVFRPC